MAKTSKEGQYLYSNRIRFMVKDFHDLCRSNWEFRTFREQATTRKEVKKNAAVAAKASAMSFSTKIFGARPAGIDDFKELKMKQRHPELQRPNPELKSQELMEEGRQLRQDNMQEVEQGNFVQFDHEYLKRILSYFAEDQDVSSFTDHWRGRCEDDIREGLKILLLIGLDSMDGEGMCAKAVVQLIIQQVVSWNMLKDALTPLLADLEDILLDAPNADKFFHSLLARLLMSCDEKMFDPVVFKALPIVPGEHCKLVWDLLVGTLEKSQELGGPAAASRARACEEFVAAAHAAWGKEQPPDLARCV